MRQCVTPFRRTSRFGFRALLVTTALGSTAAAAAPCLEEDPAGFDGLDRVQDQVDALASPQLKDEAYRSALKSETELRRYLRRFAADARSLEWFEREILPRAREVERRFHLPATFFACVLARESGIGRLAFTRSPRGAVGVAQITPQALAEFSERIIPADVQLMERPATTVSAMIRASGAAPGFPPFDSLASLERFDPEMTDYLRLKGARLKEIRDRVRTEHYLYGLARRADCGSGTTCNPGRPRAPELDALTSPAQAVPVAAALLSHHLHRTRTIGVHTRARDLTVAPLDQLYLAAAAYNAGFAGASTALRKPGGLRLRENTLELDRERLPAETRDYLTALERCMAPGNFAPPPGTPGPGPLAD